MNIADEFSQNLKDGLTPFQRKLNEVLNYLKKYVKNPVQAMHHLPHWDWETLIAVYAAAAAICGTLSGVISFRIANIFVGLFFFPISACVGAFLLATLFYYTYSFIFRQEVSLKFCFTIVSLSLFPFFALYTFASLVEPLKLVGFAASGMLLIVGFSQNTHVEKKKIVRFVIGLYVFYFVFWGYQLVRFQSDTKHLKDLATPESYDQLKKELSQ